MKKLLLLVLLVIPILLLTACGDSKTPVTTEPIIAGQEPVPYFSIHSLEEYFSIKAALKSYADADDKDSFGSYMVQEFGLSGLSWDETNHIVEMIDDMAQAHLIPCVKDENKIVYQRFMCNRFGTSFNLSYKLDNGIEYCFKFEDLCPIQSYLQDLPQNFLLTSKVESGSGHNCEVEAIIHSEIVCPKQNFGEHTVDLYKYEKQINGSTSYGLYGEMNVGEMLIAVEISIPDKFTDTEKSQVLSNPGLENFYFTPEKSTDTVQKEKASVGMTFDEFSALKLEYNTHFNYIIYVNDKNENVVLKFDGAMSKIEEVSVCSTSKPSREAIEAIPLGCSFVDVVKKVGEPLGCRTFGFASSDFECADGTIFRILWDGDMNVIEVTEVEYD